MRSLRNLLRGQRFYGASALVGILALNLIVCRRMFSIEYPRWLESIEAVYPAIASWILRHWPDLGWMPDWYCGIPFQNSYPPVLPATTAALSAVLRLSDRTRLPRLVRTHILPAAVVADGAGPQTGRIVAGGNLRGRVPDDALTLCPAGPLNCS